MIVADCFSQTIRQKSSKAGGTGPILRVNEDISLKQSCSLNNNFRVMHNLQEDIVNLHFARNVCARNELEFKGLQTRLVGNVWG